MTIELLMDQWDEILHTYNKDMRIVFKKLKENE